MIKEEGVLAESSPRRNLIPYWRFHRCAVIFGTTGGVMEAALRSGYYLVTGKNPEPMCSRR